MEIVRSDFLALLDEVRRALHRVVPELQTPKARDDVENVGRILTLLEAEHDFLRDNFAGLMAAYDRVAETLAPLTPQTGLASLHAGLAHLAVGQFSSPYAQLAATRVLYQNEIPAIGALADDGVAEARDALAMLLDIETAQFEAVHARRKSFELHEPAQVSGATASDVRKVGGVHEMERETLRDYLRSVFPDETALDITQIHNIPGGRSKETTMITLSGVRNLPEKIVMRSDIPGGLVPSRTVDEFAILQIADRHGVPVPKPLFCETDPGKLGLTFIIVSAVSGSTQGEYFPDLGGRVQDKAGVGKQLARILARINSIPLSELDGTHIDTSADLTELVRQTIETTYQQARNADSPARVHLELAYRWLMANLHLADDEPCLIHCDVGLHNILIEDNRITAMLDWELATIASPSREISKIFHLIDYLMPREEFFAEYLATGGPERAINVDRMNFYAIMNYMVTHQRARYANNLFYSGSQRNIVMGHAGYDSFYRGITLISNVLKPVYADAYGRAQTGFTSGERNK